MLISYKLKPSLKVCKKQRTLNISVGSTYPKNVVSVSINIFPNPIIQNNSIL